METPVSTEMFSWDSGGGATDSMTVMPMEMNGRGVVLEGDVRTHYLQMRESRKHIPNFEEVLKNIDGDIYNDLTLPNSKAVDPKTLEYQVTRSSNLVDITVMEGDHVWENQIRGLTRKLSDTKAGGENNKVEFNMGWTETGLVGVAH